ncbi:MAG: glycosyltransferase [Abditibacteriota bacterium]|nr:glycosyltransferase [Abditibacteriota bacterium]
MKAALIIHRLSRSGAPKIMVWLAEYLTRRGHDVTLVSLYDCPDSLPVPPEVRLKALDIRQSGNPLVRKTVGLWRAEKRLLQVLRETRPDLCLTFMDTAGLLLLLVKGFCGLRVYCSERADPDRGGPLSAFIRKRLTLLSDGVVFQTEGARDCFRGLALPRSRVIPNPVSVPPAPAKEDRPGTLVWAGRFDNRQKRLDLLLRAFALVLKTFPEERLTLYGDGPDMPRIRRLAEKLGIEGSVDFAGFEPDLARALAAGKVFVMSSDFEGIPNTLIEAMAAGLPCAVTDCSPGGARVLIRDGVDGLITPRGDARALAEAVTGILSDPELARTLGANAALITDRFAPDRIGAEWEEFLTEGL